MRKQLTILALLAAASLPAKDIFVNTPRTTLLLKAEDNKPLHISFDISIRSRCKALHK